MCVQAHEADRTRHNEHALLDEYTRAALRVHGSIATTTQWEHHAGSPRGKHSSEWWAVQRARTPLEFSAGTLGGKSIKLARIIPRGSPGQAGQLSLPAVDTSPKLDARLRQNATRMRQSWAMEGEPGTLSPPRRSALGFPLDENGFLVLGGRRERAEGARHKSCDF